MILIFITINLSLLLFITKISISQLVLSEEFDFVKKEQSKQYIVVTEEQLRQQGVQQVAEVPHHFQRHTTDELADEMNYFILFLFTSLNHILPSKNNF